MFCWGNLMARDHLGDQGIDGIIIFEWIIIKTVEWAWTGLSWLKIWTSGGLF